MRDPNPPRIILVPTVPHTGTRFLTDKLFGSVGYERFNVLTGEHVYEKNDRVILHSHFQKRRYLDICELVWKYPIMSSLRKPYSILQSWKKRKADSNNFYAQCLQGFTFIYRHWPIMSILPIEEENRDVYLENLSDTFNVILRTDWAKHESCGIRKDIELTTEENNMIAVLDKMYEEIINIYNMKLEKATK